MTTRVPVPATQELLEELRGICAATAELPIGQVTAEADLAAELGVDSLTRDELVEKALERYGLSTVATTAHAESFPTLRALAELIQRLNGERSGGAGD